MPIVHYPEVVFQEHPRSSKFKDISGLTYSRLTVLGPAKSVNLRTMWYCQCTCGNLTVAAGKELRKGKTVSCGCYNAEKKFKHGLSSRDGKQSPMYAVWYDMMRRCYDPSRNSYPRYGGRGITVCDKWHSLEQFIADMGERPHPDLTLERVDNSKGYSPENCRWATRTEQQRNRDFVKRITFKGESRCLTEWCEILGLKFTVVWNRLYNRKWSIEDSFLTPMGKSRRK